MTLYKKICTCGREWLSNDENDFDCPDDDTEIHEVKNSTKLTSDDYAEMWGDDLENANRHDMTEIPNEILGVLESQIKDKKVIKKIMKIMYEKGIGV